MMVWDMKKIRSRLFALYIRAAEKQYKRLRYLLQTKSSSETLVVCFSGFGDGGAARYNYIKTLHTVNANKLFILDDFGFNKQGSYYLGENGDLFLPDMIVSLIEKIQKERCIKHFVMVGSSKGGSAALFYAIKLEADACIIGAPQYFIGDYLNIDKHLPILNGIMGNTNSESVQKLNCIMKNCVQSAVKHKPQVYIHYSPNEHTYYEHIHAMIDDLEHCGYMVYKDADYEYTEHSEVAKHFPQYLLSVLNKILVT